MKKLLATTALFGVLSTPPAHATLFNVDFNFSDHPGLLGDTQSYEANSFTLLARGFTGSDVGTRLFGKVAGGDETGLGLANDPSGNDEISGRNFI
jgi:hypothetical protein